MKTYRSLASATVTISWAAALGLVHSQADEGMWLFNDLPLQQLKDRYGFVPPQGWAEHLMKSSVRFNVGGSGSFISSTGLVLTNHHVASDTLFKLSTPERNIMKDGYLAKSHDQELKSPDLELNQLVNITDVTDEVKAAVKPEMTTEQAVAARRAVIATIEKSALDESGLKSTVTTLYGGGRYHLYQYKKYTDVDWSSPRSSRRRSSAAIRTISTSRAGVSTSADARLRERQAGAHARLPALAQRRSARGEPVFLAGHPGSTSRLLTAEQLKFQRSVSQPAYITRATPSCAAASSNGETARSRNASCRSSCWAGERAQGLSRPAGRVARRRSDAAEADAGARSAREGPDRPETLADQYRVG
ncbi:MAG: hypothetical protein HC872_08660 [Gammaproteobacteria bacterium]|nr:hypothetical protein [Gammaproteobacteria bacterium]